MKVFHLGRRSGRILLFIFLVFCLAGCRPGPEQQGQPGGQDKEEAEIHFLATKEDANCIFLLLKEYTVVIDTGEPKDQETILSFMEEQEVARVDYLILTHPDKDHIGGAPAILENYPVTQVIQPCYRKADERKEALDRQMEALGISVEEPRTSQKYQAGEFKITVYPPLKDEYKKDNNYSLAVLVEHGDVTMVFAGDAQKQRLEELLGIDWPKADLYQVAYHGRENPLSVEFLKQLAPRYAVSTSQESGPSIQKACLETGTELYHSVGRHTAFKSNGRELMPLETKR